MKGKSAEMQHAGSFAIANLICGAIEVEVHASIGSRSTSYICGLIAASSLKEPFGSKRALMMEQIALMCVINYGWRGEMLSDISDKYVVSLHDVAGLRFSVQLDLFWRIELRVHGDSMAIMWS